MEIAAIQCKFLFASKQAGGDVRTGSSLGGQDDAENRVCVPPVPLFPCAPARPAFSDSGSCFPNAQATRPSQPDALLHEEAVALIGSWKRFPIQEITVALLDAALIARNRWRLSYWDAAIIEAARLCGCETCSPRISTMARTLNPDSVFESRSPIAARLISWCFDRLPPMKELTPSPSRPLHALL